MHVTSTGATFVSLPGTQTTIALCHATNGQTNNDEIVDCSGAPSDLAENYGTTDTSIEAADVVVSSGESTEIVYKGFKTSKAFIAKATGAYQTSIIGVVSTQPNQLYADEIFDASENPRPVALVGRVPVKVTAENGDIHAGDWLTSSATIPGAAMKAIAPGMVIGQAISSFSGAGVGRAVVFVKTGYHDPSVLVDANGNVSVQRNIGSTTFNATTTSSAVLVLNQQGSGDILQLQANGSDRLLVKNDGSVNINAEISDVEALAFSISANSENILSLNVRGDLQIKGVIVIPDDSFAGSITTNADGLAEINFTNNLGTGKPSIQLTPEAEQPIFAQVLSWKKDGQNNYTGFTMKTFALSGSGSSATVHYLVVKKQTAYDTTVSTLQVVSTPTPQVQNPPTPPTDDGSGTVTDDGTGTTTDGGTTSGDGSTVTDPTPPTDNSGTTDTGTSADGSGATTDPGTTTGDGGTVTTSTTPDGSGN